MTEEYIRSLTDRARLQERLRKQRILENYRTLIRVIENGEEFD